MEHSSSITRCPEPTALIWWGQDLTVYSIEAKGTRLVHDKVEVASGATIETYGQCRAGFESGDAGWFRGSQWSRDSGRDGVAAAAGFG